MRWPAIMGQALAMAMFGTLAQAQASPPPASCAAKFVGEWTCVVKSTNYSYPCRVNADGTSNAKCFMCMPVQRWTCEGNKYVLLDPYRVDVVLAPDGKTMESDCCKAIRLGPVPEVAIARPPAPPGANVAVARPSPSSGSAGQGGASPMAAACGSYFPGASFDAVRRTCLAPKVTEAVCLRIGGRWHKDRGYGADVCEYGLPQEKAGGSVASAASDSPTGSGVPLAKADASCPQGFGWIGGYLCAAYNVDASFCSAHGGRFFRPGYAPTRCVVDSTASSENVYDTAGRPVQNNIYDTTGGPPLPARYGRSQAASRGSTMSPAERRKALREAIAKRNPLVRRPMPVDEPTSRSVGRREQEALFLLARLQTASFVDELGTLLQQLQALTVRFPEGAQKAALKDAIGFYRKHYEVEKDLAAEDEAQRAGGEREPPLVELSPEIREWFSKRPAPGEYPTMGQQDCRDWKGVYGALTGCLIQPYDRAGSGELRMLMIVDDEVSVAEDPTGRTVRALVEATQRELN